MTQTTLMPVVAKDLCRSFGNAWALRDVSFVLKPGTVVGLLGRNGAGKTTLIRMLVGLLRPDTGQALIHGHVAGHVAARRLVGAMIQDVQFPGVLRVGELLRFLQSGYAQPLPLSEVLVSAGITGLAGLRYDQLSTGQKRRVQCAAAICGDPAVLVLDEPTAHMDQDSKEVFWSMIDRFRRRDKAVLLVSHQWDEVEALADRVVLLSDGQLTADMGVDEIRQRAHGAKVSFTAEIDTASIARWAGVRSTVRKGRRVEALVEDAAAFLRQLETLPQPVSELSVSVPMLEDTIRSLAESRRGEHA